MIKNNEVLGAVNRGIPCESGLCTQCRMDCKGQCETFLASTRGRRMLYTQEPVGTVTYSSANMSPQGISYNSLKIQGRLIGASGTRRENQKTQHYLTSSVDVSTEFGWKKKTKCRVPIQMGAALNVVNRYWDSYAYAAALIGYPIVIGENAMNMDSELKIVAGEVKEAPRIERMIEPFFRYYDGYGGIVVQVNYDDIYNGNKTLDYICKKYGNRILIEIKFGQGGKCINGEVITSDLKKALQLSCRYPVYPDPQDEKVQEEFKAGKIRRFTRLSCVPFADLDSYEQAEEEFVSLVAHIREMGVDRVLLKTTGFSMESLAATLRMSSKAHIDLITFDGSGGGTAHSPWPMMEHWGVPSILLHAKAVEYAEILKQQGKYVPDFSFGGGFAREDQIFKACALGAPFVKNITMCRSMIIPGAVGANIEGVLYPMRRADVHGEWQTLPESIAVLGNSADKIFECYTDVKAKVGSDEIKKLPFGTIALWTYIDKLMTGLRQLMAGARTFSLDAISRDSIAAVNRETERETGIAFITEAGKEKALEILKNEKGW